MAWMVVKGIYREGMVEPLELAPHREGVEVLVLFPESVRRSGANGIWQQIKRETAKEIPDLLSMTDNQRREEFEKLSSVIAERVPYRSPEEFERAMRGDQYGLAGH